MDWKGRPARRGKHGGVKSIFPLLGKLLTDYISNRHLTIIEHDLR